MKFGRSRLAAICLAVVAGSGLGVVVATSGSTAPPIEQHIAAYERLLGAVYGTPEDRIAGERAQHAQMQAAIRGCMANKGFGYQPPAYSGIAGGTVSPGDYEVGTPLGDFGIASAMKQHTLGVQATLAAGDNKPGRDANNGPDQGRAYGAAMDHCGPLAHPFQNAHVPAGQEAVALEIEAALARLQKIDEAQNLMAGYTACLRTAGYVGVTTRAGLYAIVNAKFDPFRERPWSAVNDPAWAGAVTDEKNASAADARCRTPLYHWGVAQMRPTVDRLSADTRVAGLSNGWAKLRTQAVGLN